MGEADQRGQSTRRSHDSVPTSHSRGQVIPQAQSIEANNAWFVVPVDRSPKSSYTFILKNFYS